MSEGAEELKLKIMDSDIGSDDFVGEAEWVISINLWMDQTFYFYWINFFLYRVIKSLVLTEFV